MKLEHYLRLRTQDPKFLWRMVFAILAIGVVLGAVVQLIPHRISPDPSAIDDAIFTITQHGDRTKVIEVSAPAFVEKLKEDGVDILLAAPA